MGGQMNKRTLGGGVRRERHDKEHLAKVLEAREQIGFGEGFEVFEFDCVRCAEEARAKLTEEEDIAAIFNPRFNRMFLCSTCGNKRCPKASDHRLVCTNSNEPGQKGSIYE